MTAPTGTSPRVAAALASTSARCIGVVWALVLGGVWDILDRSFGGQHSQDFLKI